MNLHHTFYLWSFIEQLDLAGSEKPVDTWENDILLIIINIDMKKKTNVLVIAVISNGFSSTSIFILTRLHFLTFSTLRQTDFTPAGGETALLSPVPTGLQEQPGLSVDLHLLVSWFLSGKIIYVSELLRHF